MPALRSCLKMPRARLGVVDRHGRGDARFLRAPVGVAHHAAAGAEQPVLRERAQVEQPRLDLLHAKAEDQLEARLHAKEGEHVQRARFVTPRGFLEVHLGLRDEAGRAHVPRADERRASARRNASASRRRCRRRAGPSIHLCESAARKSMWRTSIVVAPSDWIASRQKSTPRRVELLADRLVVEPVAAQDNGTRRARPGACAASAP